MDSLPEELQFRNVSSKKKTILEKQQRQVLPSNGTEQTANFSSGPQIVFRIPIDNEWSIQMDSAHLVADLTVKGLDANSASYNNLKLSSINTNAAVALPILAPCESYESFIYRIAVYLNGSELERIDNYSYLETFKHNWCNNQNWVNLMSGGMGLGQSILEKSRLFLVGASGTTSNTVQIGFPLRYLGLFNIKTLLPAYLLGPNSLEIRIWMAPASECFTHGLLTNTAANGYNHTNFVASTATTLNYTLSNIHMNINYIQTEPSYNNALSQYLISNNLQIPIETYFITQFPINRGQNGWVNQNISIQYSNINSIYIIFTRNTEQGSLRFLGTDRMHPIEGLSQARLTVNGKVMPAVPIALQNPAYLAYPATGQNISALNNAGLLNSGLVGQAYCQQPEALNYLMKALGYNTSAEMLGQVNFPVSEGQPLYTYTSGGAGAASGIQFKTIPSKVGAGAFYASNKAVQYNSYLSGAGGALADNTFLPDASSNPLICEEIFWKTPSYFALGWSMTRSDYSDEFELSGYNASSNSGIIQVGLQFAGSCNEGHSVTASNTKAQSAAVSQVTPVDNYNAWVIIEHTRILDIGKDNAQVLY
jgi:hypothetical protein